MNELHNDQVVMIDDHIELYEVTNFLMTLRCRRYQCPKLNYKSVGVGNGLSACRPLYQYGFDSFGFGMVVSHAIQTVLKSET